MDASEVLDKIETLNATLWEYKALKPRVDAWLQNFDVDEREEIVQLLPMLMYFSGANIRYLLRTLYQDLYRRPIVDSIRKNNYDTLDTDLIEAHYLDELNATRFLGVGNPSESGAYLLYFFRQENKIKKDLFVHTDDVIFPDGKGGVMLNPKYNNVKRFVFIDDLCGSGAQATDDTSNVKRCVTHIRTVVKDAQICYYMLFGLEQGLKRVKDSGLYNSTNAVILLDESYCCFGPDSRFFKNDTVKNRLRDIAHKHGKRIMGIYIKELYPGMPLNKIDLLSEKHSLGYADCQLLLSLYHNTPDNTLPIIWYDEDEEVWTPIFKRYQKIY